MAEKKELDPKPSDRITKFSEDSVKDQYLLKKRFKIIRSLGQGGMGNVYLCQDQKLHRMVAVKYIREDKFDQSVARQRFLREAQTASQLDHENICNIYEIYEEDEGSYIVMQFIGGITLDQLINYKKPSLRRLIHISSQICEGLQEAHSNNIIHRDIKPSNIILDRKERVKILDFGLAKFTGKAEKDRDDSFHSKITQAGVILGTASYMSPEQVKDHKLDHRTDIFSFGILLYEMVELKNPFYKKDQITTLYNIMNQQVEIQRDVPPILKEIITRCLEKDKKNRYQRFDQILEDLKKLSKYLDDLKEGDGEPDHGETEVITLHDKKKFLDEISSSGNENFKDIVNKVKKLKRSTASIKIIKSSLFLKAAIPILVMVLVYVMFFRVGKQPVQEVKSALDQPLFLISICDFETGIKDDPQLPGKIRYLLTETLNQFEEFSVIPKTELLEIHKGKGAPGSKLDYSKYNVTYELTGKYDQDFVFEVNLNRIRPEPGSENTYPITVVGKNPESLLTNQIDSLTRDVYLKIFPDKKFSDVQLKPVSSYLGTDWGDFDNYYRGINHLKKLELSPAREYLIKAGKIPLSNLPLAELYWFEAKKGEVRSCLEKLRPVIEQLPMVLKYRVLARSASLDLNIRGQIANLEKINKKLPLSKDIIFEIAEAYFYRGDAENAKYYYLKALALDKNYSAAINHLGYCYSYLGEHNQAINHLEKYRTLDQTANSFDSLGDGYFYEGRFNRAENLKEQAIIKNEKSVPWAYMTIADINLLKGRYQTAEEKLQKYFSLMGDSQSEAYFLSRSGYIRYLQGDSTEALNRINQAIEIAEDLEMDMDLCAESHWLKGLVLIGEKKITGAEDALEWLKVFNEAFNITADDFMASYKYYLHLRALIQELKGEAGPADRTFQMLLSLKPKLSFQITYFHYQFFATEYASFLNRQKKEGEALVIIKDCLEFNPNYIPCLELKYKILSGRDQNESEIQKLKEQIVRLKQI